MTGKNVIGRKANTIRHALLTSCALGLVLPNAALAGDITIPSGTTVTTTQVLTDDGDTGTVDSGGTIDVVDEDGLILANDDQTALNNGDILVERTSGGPVTGIGSFGENSTITNAGTITTTGDAAYGIIAVDDFVSITNSGTITTDGEESFAILATDDDAVIVNDATLSTSGDDADAIHADDDDAQVTNNGTILTTGVDAHGIDADGDNPVVINNGTITTTGENGHGLESDADNATFTNNGSITVSGAEADGIDIDGENASVTNTGSISTAGDQGNGIDVNGDGAVVSNSGTLTASGPDSNGVEISSANATITNSGTITNTGTRTGSDAAAGHGISVVGDNATVTVTPSGTVSSENGSAIYIDGANATVTLQNGSVISGGVTFTDASSASFAYNGTRTALFGFTSVPGTLTSDGLAVGTNGSTVTFLNPDEFQLGTTSLTFNALSRELADVVEDQMNTAGLAGSGFVATNGAPAETVSDRWSVWASPFGGLLNRDGSNGFDHSFGGLMAGADRGFGPDYRAGVTAGFSFGRTDSDNDVHSADTYSIFAGAYATRNWQQTFAQVSLLGGYLNSAEEVTVLNSMVAGGLQDLSIDYDYIFVTPSARVGHAIALAHGTLTPSVRARYSGLWQSGNATESTTGLSVSGRSLNVLELRGETAFDFTPVVADGGAVHVGLAAGVDGIFTLSDEVDGDLAGTALNLSIDNDDAVIRGFGRANAVWKSNGGAEFLASVEGGYDSAETLSATMRLGGKIRF